MWLAMSMLVQDADVREGLLAFTIFFNSSQTCPGVTEAETPGEAVAGRNVNDSSSGSTEQTWPLIKCQNQGIPQLVSELP